MTTIYHDMIARLTYRSFGEGFGLGAHSEAGLPEMPARIKESWMESRMHSIGMSAGILKPEDDLGNGRSDNHALHELLARYSTAAGRLLLTAFIEGFRSGAISESSANVIAAGGEETEQIEYSSNTHWLNSLSHAKLQDANKISAEESERELQLEGSMHGGAGERTEEILAEKREALRMFLQGAGIHDKPAEEPPDQQA
jgi:hypothetical protein